MISRPTNSFVATAGPTCGSMADNRRFRRVVRKEDSSSPLPGEMTGVDGGQVGSWECGIQPSPSAENNDHSLMALLPLLHNGLQRLYDQFQHFPKCLRGTSKMPYPIVSPPATRHPSGPLKQFTKARIRENNGGRVIKENKRQAARPVHLNNPRPSLGLSR